MIDNGFAILISLRYPFDCFALIADRIKAYLPCERLRRAGKTS
jgi:hypothetical protein